MRKEDICLDLGKLSKNEIKEVYRILKENNQELLFAYIGCISNGNYFKKEKFLVFCRPSSNSWTCSKDFKDRYEINLQQFKELFKKENILSEAEFKLEAIKRGFIKGNTFKPLSGGEEVLIENGLLDFEHYNIKYNYTVYIQDAYIYENGKWAEVTIFNNNDISIPNDLKVGQEIEVNGFVLKVDRTIKKWYLFKNKDTNSIAYEFFDSNDLKYYKTEENIELTEITDQDFINQLEIFSN